MTEAGTKPLRIVVSEYNSLKAWCDLLNCEEADLLSAIYTVGTSVQAVDDFLVLNSAKDQAGQKY